MTRTRSTFYVFLHFQTYNTKTIFKIYRINREQCLDKLVTEGLEQKVKPMHAIRKIHKLEAKPGQNTYLFFCKLASFFLLLQVTNTINNIYSRNAGKDLCKVTIVSCCWATGQSFIVDLVWNRIHEYMIPIA